MKEHGGILSAYCLVKEASLKRLHMYDFNHMTFWKRQNYRDKIKISGYQGTGWGAGMKNRRFLGQ